MNQVDTSLFRGHWMKFSNRSSGRSFIMMPKYDFQVLREHIPDIYEAGEQVVEFMMEREQWYHLDYHIFDNVLSRYEELKQEGYIPLYLYVQPEIEDAVERIFESMMNSATID